MISLFGIYLKKTRGKWPFAMNKDVRGKAFILVKIGNKTNL
jgi:hypothetical protein